MKFRTRLVIYYLIATLTAISFVGFAVLKGIDRLSINIMEQQLIGESKLAEIYISQIAVLGNSSPGDLDTETASKTINNLSMSLGNVRIYNKSLGLLASSGDSFEKSIPSDINSKVLTNALKGNYAYIVRDKTVYFASSLDLQGVTSGILEIVYPLSFLNNLTGSLSNILLYGAALFAVLMTILSIYISGRITKPIRQLADATQNFAKRDFTPVDIQSPVEIAQLCRSFNAMGIQLKDYIQRQKLFVSNVSHELRTPLTAIKGYSEYLTDEVKDNAELQKAVYHLNNESNRLTRLIDGILTLSRIDSGREDFSFERLSFSRLVKETIEKMSLRAEKYGINIYTDINPDIFICGDSEKLIQVLVNLIDNAIKFSPARAFIRIRLYKDSDTAYLVISDQGIGIPQDEIAKIFERFYRAENAKGISGTGLGLSIVKDIADAHKGRIIISAGPDGGTTVELRLPAVL